MNLQKLDPGKIGKREIIRILETTHPDELREIYDYACKIRNETIGNKVYTRALIELSNKCQKDCLYCGIRASNNKVKRYELSDEEVLKTVNGALAEGYKSFVIQSGERQDSAFVNRISQLLQQIQKFGDNKIRITLSCGEQHPETYIKWKKAGADRYLLRFESSDQKLFETIHPNNQKHKYNDRIAAIVNLRKAGFQVGSGMMIGLPGQTLEMLADDLCFLKELDVHMVGMGPFLEHPDTPLSKSGTGIHESERYRLALLCVSALRILMPKINIAAATALDSINAMGRLDAIEAGANVLMPNCTPLNVRENYFLYKKKSHLTESRQLLQKFISNQNNRGFILNMNAWGDSRAYKN